MNDNFTVFVPHSLIHHRSNILMRKQDFRMNINPEFKITFFVSDMEDHFHKWPVTEAKLQMEAKRKFRSNWNEDGKSASEQTLMVHWSEAVLFSWDKLLPLVAWGNGTEHIFCCSEVMEWYSKQNFNMVGDRLHTKPNCHRCLNNYLLYAIRLSVWNKNFSLA